VSIIKKLLVVLLVLLVVAVGVALVVANSKFQAITASPVVSHATLVTPDTRLQIVAKVPMMKDIIEQQFLKDTGVPPQILPLALPYEAAVLVDVDNILDEIKMSLFINDKRLAPIIMQFLNDAQLPPPLNAWFPNPMEARGRGTLVREGTTQPDPAIMDYVKQHWPNASVVEPLDIEGGHMVEAALDNRDGGLMEIIGTVAAAQGTDVVEQLKALKDQTGFDVEAIPATIKFLRVQADVTPDDTLEVHIALDCEKDMAPIILMGFQMGFPSLRDKAGKAGIDVKGGAALKGTVIEGDYSVPNFSVLLATVASFM